MRIVHRLVAPLALAVVAAAACTTEVTPTAGPSTSPVASIASSPGGETSKRVLACSSLPAESDTQLIGARGGVLHVGPHMLEIPAGALTVPVTITASAPRGSAAVVNFEPHGLQFNGHVRPTLTLSYAHCSTVAAAKEVIYTDGTLNRVLETRPSKDDAAKQAVSAPIDHFSSYVVAF
jgi:hypothetical protein